DRTTAEAIAARFVEVVIARSVSDDALEVLASKKALRVLTAPPPGVGVGYRGIDGGFLVQQADLFTDEEWEVVSERAPSDSEMDALRFAWVVAAHAKSNAIVISNGTQAVGVGAGDQSRVGAG